jgi:hypothetical protein
LNLSLFLTYKIGHLINVIGIINQQQESTTKITHENNGLTTRTPNLTFVQSKLAADKAATAKNRR